MKNIMLISLASAIFVGGLMNPVPGFAQEASASETRVSVVRAADLDLRSKAGRRQLDRRLGAAARRVCGTASESDLLGKNELRRCRDKALRQAKERSNAFMVGVEGGQLVALPGSR